METNRYETLMEFSQAAAELIRETALDAVEKRGWFSLVLAGGSSPRAAYALLAKMDDMPWEQTHVFFSDERCVEHDDPLSNYRMARETLLDHVAIPAMNIHYMKCAVKPWGLAAGGYDLEIRNFFHYKKLKREDGSCPFDLLLLGMGADGHTASLFPGRAEVAAKKRLVAPVDEPIGSPKVERITLTLPVLNAARMALFLVAGADKRPVLDEIWEDPDAAMWKYPAALIRPQERLVWMATDDAGESAQA